ncbi:MAG: putative DNA binding domain-containing protein [Treponema sp.]|jgi:predicted HTH transcriptional regulator|nr:putative DNA binding domain-containing protein [Treponema sp.]
MNAAELEGIIRLGETSRVQFKLTLDHQDKIAAELIAMANAKGGMIVFGVEDKTGDIAGLDYATLQTINNKMATIANDLVKPPVYLFTEALKLKQRNLLIVYIDEGVNKPYKDNNGTIWLKQGSDKRKLLDNAEIARLFQQSANLSADEMEVYGTSINDVDEWLFSTYFKGEFGYTWQEKNLSFEQALRVKKVLRNKHLTLAGLLFFGREPQAWKPAFTIKTVSFFGNDITGTAYRNKQDDIPGPIPELYKQGMMFLSSNLRHLQKDPDFNSRGVLEISEIALRETLQNALIHRDYFKNAPVRLFVFDNRVEIISPGTLPNSLTVEEVKYGNPVIRNNQIAALSSRTLPYSGLGSGLRRAFAEQPDIELVNDTAGEQFIVRIPRPAEV